MSPPILSLRSEINKGVLHKDDISLSTVTHFQQNGERKVNNALVGALNLYLWNYPNGEFENISSLAENFVSTLGEYITLEDFNTLTKIKDKFAENIFNHISNF